MLTVGFGVLFPVETVADEDEGLDIPVVVDFPEAAPTSTSTSPDDFAASFSNFTPSFSNLTPAPAVAVVDQLLNSLLVFFNLSTSAPSLSTFPCTPVISSTHFSILVVSSSPEKLESFSFNTDSSSSHPSSFSFLSPSLFSKRRLTAAKSSLSLSTSPTNPWLSTIRRTAASSSFVLLTSSRSLSVTKALLVCSERMFSSSSSSVSFVTPPPPPPPPPPPLFTSEDFSPSFSPSNRIFPSKSRSLCSASSLMPPPVPDFSILSTRSPSSLHTPAIVFCAADCFASWLSFASPSCATRADNSSTVEASSLFDFA